MSPASLIPELSDAPTFAGEARPVTVLRRCTPQGSNRQALRARGASRKPRDFIILCAASKQCANRRAPVACPLRSPQWRNGGRFNFAGRAFVDISENPIGRGQRFISSLYAPESQIAITRRHVKRQVKNICGFGATVLPVPTYSLLNMAPDNRNRSERGRCNRRMRVVPEVGVAIRLGRIHLFSAHGKPMVQRTPLVPMEVTAVRMRPALSASAMRSFTILRPSSVNLLPLSTPIGSAAGAIQFR